VWLDVPVDVQGADVDSCDLRHYDPAEDAICPDRQRLAREVGEVLELLDRARRPVILAGSGVRIAGAGEALLAVAGLLGTPVTTAWCHDLVSNDDPQWCGRPGTIGDRAGNFTVQNADVLLVVGSRLNIRQVSYNWASFAPHATVVQVDVDEAELRKPTVRLATGRGPRDAGRTGSPGAASACCGTRWCRRISAGRRRPSIPTTSSRRCSHTWEMTTSW
jgi:acetolactate synthase-1/2/3 large subunit